ncbi:MAG: serine hydrolase [bacterium]|nr:serine hydrolase [bacterium]
MKKMFSLTISLLCLSVTFGILPAGNVSGDTGVMPTTVPDDYVNIDATMRVQDTTYHYDGEYLSLQVESKTMSTVSSLKFSRVMTAYEALTFLPPAPGFTFGSAVYMYDFGTQGQGDIEKNMTLSVLYGGTDPNAYLAFYDRNKQTWRPFPSTHKDHHVIAQTTLPYSQIAVIEKRPWVSNNGVDLWAIPAKAVYITDQDNNVLLSKNSSNQLPIASITKLMTVLVFLDHNPGWDTVITFQKSDDTIPAKFYFKIGEQITVKDAFYGALVGSKNNAAKMLARSTGFSSEVFAQKMNEKAQELGMKDSVFVEPTGLDEGNKSTAKDLAILTQTAYSHASVLAAAETKRYVFKTLKFKEVASTKNSNALLEKVGEVLAGKTGYTQEAGYSMAAQGKTADGGIITVVLLGAPDNTIRFDVVGTLTQIATKNGKFTFRIAGL